MSTKLKVNLGVIFFSCLIASCDKQVDQIISGSIKLEKIQVIQKPVRIYSSYKKCEGNYMETMTDSNGAFTFNTTSTRGGLAVVTQSIALCISKENKWQPLWSTIVGGGANQIILNCTSVGKNSDEEFCDIKMNYNEKDS